MEGEDEDQRRVRRTQATVYDAVAGRVGYEGFLSDQQPSTYRDTLSTTSAAVPPEEVLFRRVGAPVRYAEDDIYTQDRYLQPDQQLPDSDLMKALHAYAADFYEATTGDQCKQSLQSMDETALLAMGILLEEAACEALGQSGDLALVESPQDEPLAKPSHCRNGQRARSSVFQRSERSTKR